MSSPQTKTDTLGYLLGGVGLLAISIIPVFTVMLGGVQLDGKLAIMAYWLLGVLLIAWVVRRFTKLSERVVAILATVIGWYIVLQILFVLETMVFRL
ncbi:hypothetical protein [Hymenobacter baengnokdamensis]|uniref:hypothetical protein n=1 Tax=Hymenobacter baengnokdamensis TaxID=2615203 RepID=UPI0012483434|nr:hypothetical protein [Hymenobacter baengnokdamensis]